MKKWLGYCLVCMIWVGVSLPVASQGVEVTAEMQLKLAAMLYEEGDYYRAITEYKRFLYYFPDNDLGWWVRYRIGMSEFYRREWSAAMGAFESVVLQSEGALSEIQEESWLMLGECLAQQKNYTGAIQVLGELAEVSAQELVRNKARYRISWWWIELGYWEEAVKALDKLTVESQKLYGIERLKEEILSLEENNRRSSLAAGIMSGVMPGMGYAYCGRYNDALTAMVLNGILILTAAESFRKGHNALGTLVTMIELGVYTGTIYGSVNAAKTHNKRQNREFIQSLKQRFKIIVSGEPSWEFKLVFHNSF